MASPRNFLGRGFAFPPKVDTVTGRFLMVEAEEDIRQSIYIILATRRGERVMQPEFGCNIHDFVFDLPSGPALSGVIGEINQALMQWEPRITDTEVDVDDSRLAEGRILFDIRYVVRDTNNPNNLVFPYYLYEGVGQE